MFDYSVEMGCRCGCFLGCYCGDFAVWFTGALVVCYMDILGLILLVSSVYLDLCVYRFD